MKAADRKNMRQPELLVQFLLVSVKTVLLS